jgi:tripartite-type tricarboxylate transporter receptor subunit TctC
VYERTSAAIINRLNREALRVLARTDVKSKFLTTGTEVAGSTPQQLDNLEKADTAKRSKIKMGAASLLEWQTP